MQKETEVKTNSNVSSMSAEWFKQASELCNGFGLYEELGLENSMEKTLFNLYIAIRFVRADYYNTSYLLSRPGIFASLKNPLIRKLILAVDRNDRNARLSEQGMLATEEKLKGFLTGNTQKLRVRVLELAANDLISKSMSENSRGTGTEFLITEDMVSQWSPKWKNELNSVKS